MTEANKRLVGIVASVMCQKQACIKHSGELHYEA